jgi:uncharacterized protein with HEPN domain
MSRSDTERIADILEAISAITTVKELAKSIHPDHPATAVIVDAITYRLLTIGEAVKGLSVDFTSRHPLVPWRDITGLRDIIAHQYHRRDINVIVTTIGAPLESLERALSDA